MGSKPADLAARVHRVRHRAVAPKHERRRLQVRPALVRAGINADRLRHNGRVETVRDDEAETQFLDGTTSIFLAIR